MFAMPNKYRVTGICWVTSKGGTRKDSKAVKVDMIMIADDGNQAEKYVSDKVIQEGDYSSCYWLGIPTIEEIK